MVDAASTSYGHPSNSSVCGNSSLFTYYSEFHRSWDGAGITEAIVLVVICAGSLSTNLAVIYCALKHPSLRTTTNYFVINLAVADTVFAMTMPFVASVRISDAWIFHDIVCKLLPLSQLLCGAVLLWTLTVISIERYRCIVSHPLKPHFTTRGALVVIGAAWVIPVALCVPLANYFEVVAVSVGNDRGLPVCTLCYPQKEGRFRVAGVFLSFMIIGLAVLPASIMMYCYCNIFRKLKATNTFSVSLKMHRRGRGGDDAVVGNGDRPMACRKCSQLILDDGSSLKNTPQMLSRMNTEGCKVRNQRETKKEDDDDDDDDEEEAEQLEAVEVKLEDEEDTKPTDVDETQEEDDREEVKVAKRVTKRERLRKKFASGRILALMKHEHNSRVVRILIVDVLAVVLMWAPIWAILIAIYVDSADGAAKTIKSHDFIYCLTVAYANSWVNAILYGVLNGNFRPYICYK